MVAQDLGINLMVSFCCCLGAHEVMGEAGLSTGRAVFNVGEDIRYTVSSELWYRMVRSWGPRRCWTAFLRS